ncbi:TetR family transcriptional regulator [Paraburkholderia nemoris]|uniref:HTH-type transcriptional repressor FabR n=1 Tax=Paraburkholderia nemoris TaxID=2793076 RepID=A0ABM8RC92_9BURK|nr:MULTISPECIES: TetR family transcriptional regulator [Paraburkholderia]KPD14648.1 TetR family transcriptional regulator [Burkholderia sp. ST111]MBK5151059.1 TetR family transcriptional regulator [Burkholderia sp. R-69608]MBK3741369.1 TetR family transcriptional regulator [Paraburkholderia aspalathi]MBK3785068.1 TetR family transcriptional regulator [Paraburkholderia aspalathi]MBK3811029.1 TetR family transcriptional regulator [Paraburkholderia aspalathi]
MKPSPEAALAADHGAVAGQDLPPGKRKLIEAALRLTAGGRSFASLGLRELAREAGLNPNTFYRHFDTLDDLAHEAVESVSRRLRPMLRRERWLAAHDEPLSVPRRACVAFFAFALENREAFMSALAEYHGTSPALREAVRANLHEVSAEMADDVVQLELMPTLVRATVDEVCTQIVLLLFHLSAEYIDGNAERRDALVGYAERFIVRLFAGSMLLAQHEPVRAPA